MTTTSDKTIAERLSAPSPTKPHKRCGGDKFPKVEHPEHAHGKKVYERPSSGLYAPGGGHSGHPSPKSDQRSPTRAHIKTVPPKIETGLVVGSPERMQQSAERERSQASPHGKKNVAAVLPGGPSPKTTTTFMSPTESSARRKQQIQAERAAFPSKPPQPNPWEKPGLNPTAAINMHANHGVSINAILHGADAELSPDEIARARETGAAGASGSCVPHYKDLPEGGKKTGSDAVRVDHVQQEVFAPESSSPVVPKLKLGKKTTIEQAAKSKQWSHRNKSDSMGPRKRMHAKFSARRLAGTWGSQFAPQQSARKPTGRGYIASAVARRTNNVLGHRDPNSAASVVGPQKLTKRFLVEHRCTSSDNVFARANHKAARLEDGSASFSAASSPSRSSPIGSGNSPCGDSTKLLNSGSVNSMGGGEPPIGAASSPQRGGGKKFLSAQRPNASLKGVLNPETPRKRKEFRGVIHPFGDHNGLQANEKKMASPARIGWKAE